MRQQDLSDKTAACGRRVQRAHISRYEHGEMFPSSITFGVLVEALGCAPGDLLDEPAAAGAA
jgi:hypothetical protein